MERSLARTLVKTGASRELIRERYLPRVVRMMLIGEAPPASGRFFYCENSGLYRAIRQSFTTAFPDTSHESFLDAFYERGCFLADLCLDPVDQLKDPERRAERARCEPRLSSIIARTSPRVIVSVLKSILPNVERSIQQARWSGELLALPYPGRWEHSRKVFVRQLVPLFKTWVG